MHRSSGVLGKKSWYAVPILHLELSGCTVCLVGLYCMHYLVVLYDDGIVSRNS